MIEGISLQELLFVEGCLKLLNESQPSTNILTINCDPVDHRSCRLFPPLINLTTSRKKRYMNNCHLRYSKTPDRTAAKQFRLRWSKVVHSLNYEAILYQLHQLLGMSNISELEPPTSKTNFHVLLKLLNEESITISIYTRQIYYKSFDQLTRPRTRLQSSKHR